MTAQLYTEHVRPFPDSEGLWKMQSTGEECKAVEQFDIYGDSIFALFFDECEGPYYSIDIENEVFEKIDEAQGIHRH